MTTPDNTGTGSSKAVPLSTQRDNGRPVEPGELLTIADTLGTAKTRCAALMMAARALDFRDHEEAIAFLAEDASNIIEIAIDALNALRGGEDNGNG